MCDSEQRDQSNPPLRVERWCSPQRPFPAAPKPLTAKRKLAVPLPPTVCAGHTRRRRPSAPVAESSPPWVSLAPGLVHHKTQHLTAFAPSSPPTHFGRNTLARKPCSTSAVSFLHSLVATLTKICTRGRSTRARARASTQPPRPPTGGGPHSPSPAAPRPAPKRNPFSGLACSTGKLLHTS